MSYLISSDEEFELVQAHWHRHHEVNPAYSPMSITSLKSAMPANTLLHIDASARPGRSGTDPHGSHTRRLSGRFVDRWLATHPATQVIYRDVGQTPPSPVSADWIAAAFAPAERRSDAANSALTESNTLTEELLRADLIVIGAPMYNFGIPAQLKAWIDNVVRVGVTFGFDRHRGADRYWPLLPSGKRLVILSSRGDAGYGPGGAAEHLNLTERSIATPLEFLGIRNIYTAAVENDEFGDGRLQASIAKAEAAVDELVDRLGAEHEAMAISD
jgi:FMN-dependent NADH-azoreductase